MSKTLAEKVEIDAQDLENYAQHRTPKYIAKELRALLSDAREEPGMRDGYIESLRKLAVEFEESLSRDWRSHEVASRIADLAEEWEHALSSSPSAKPVTGIPATLPADPSEGKR